MATPAASKEGEAKDGEVQLKLDVVMLYEDFSSGLRGKGVLDCAARLFPGPSHFNLAIWRFDVLNLAIVRELALHKASVADVVVLSARGCTALPNVVKLWLKQWFGRTSDEPCALMVSLNEDSRDSASATKIISSLKASSSAGNVSMFPRFSKTRPSGGNPTVQTGQRRHSRDMARLKDKMRSPEFQDRWGINE